MRFALLALLFDTSFASENRIKIAVIDTGVSIEQEDMKYMCKDGVKNYTKTPNYDNNGHGSHIVHIIGSRIDSNKYCIVSYKVYDTSFFADANLKTLEDISRDITIRFLNVSMNGPDLVKEEVVLFNEIANRDVKITVAAGNEKMEITKDKCLQYPSCYKFKLDKPKNLYIVGANDTSYSNYGSAVDMYTQGTVLSIGGIKKGTSQASAMAMASIVNENK